MSDTISMRDRFLSPAPRAKHSTGGEGKELDTRLCLDNLTHVPQESRHRVRESESIFPSNFRLLAMGSKRGVLSSLLIYSLNPDFSNHTDFRTQTGEKICYSGLH